MADPSVTWLHDERPIRRIHLRGDAAPDPAAWPASVPAVGCFLERLRRLGVLPGCDVPGG